MNSPETQRRMQIPQITPNTRPRKSHANIVKGVRNEDKQQQERAANLIIKGAQIAKGLETEKKVIQILQARREV